MIRLLGIFLMLVMTVCMATTLLYTVQFGGINLSPIAINAAALEKVFDEAPPELLDNQDGETYMSLRCREGEGIYCYWVSSDYIKTHAKPDSPFPLASKRIDTDLTRQLLMTIELEIINIRYPSVGDYMRKADLGVIRIRCHRRVDGGKIQCQMHFGYNNKWEPVGIF
jgi:hypothetical protein